MAALAAALAAGTAGLALLSLATGAAEIPLEQAAAALLGPLAPLLGLDAPEGPSARIIQDLRLPRTLLAMTAGAGLAMVGAMLQSATRNDLADPFLFGLSSGAAAGAAAVITLTGDFLGLWTLPLAAFTGGLLSALTVCLLVARNKDAAAGPERLVLSGLAVSFLFAALTHYLVFAGDQRAAHSVLFWSLGGLGLARWDNLPFAAAGLIALAAFGFSRRRALDALLAGDETAAGLGIRPGPLRLQVFLVSAFATAAFVSLSGVIGFVGLMVPHIARSLVGPLHGRLLAFSALIGAALLLASDIAARRLLAPQELPVGIVTAAAGALLHHLDRPPPSAQLIRRTSKRRRFSGPRASPGPQHPLALGTP